MEQQQPFTLPKKDRKQRKREKKKNTNLLHDDTSAYHKTLNRCVLFVFFLLSSRSSSKQIIIMYSIFRKPKTMKCAFRYTHAHTHKTLLCNNNSTDKAIAMVKMFNRIEMPMNFTGFLFYSSIHFSLESSIEQE